MNNHVPVIIDEMNIVHQYKNLNVRHMSWTSFYSAIRHMTGAQIQPYFACANVADNSQVMESRSRFFAALRMRGITLLEGFTGRDSNNRRLEKGVDVLVALQIYKEALNGTKDIIVCSADSDLVPAILEAQSLGARIHVVVSEHFPALEITQVADRIISLETLLSSVIKNGNADFKDTSRPYLFSTKKNFSKSRMGLVSAS